MSSTDSTTATPLPQRPLGTTGLSVSAVGFGAGRIGSPDLDDAAVDRLIHTALDAGVTLFDTARSYGLSEERLGRALGPHRDRVVISTKLGYGVEGVPDWTPECITRGVDNALTRLRTDRLDLVHLHSCDRRTLEQSGVVEALLACTRAGKVRVAAYSGENEALAWAIESGAFGVVQCSVSVVDQGVLDGALPAATARGLGVLAKRPLGNAPWRFAERPAADDVALAWERFGALGIHDGGMPWSQLFTRFAAFAPGVSSILVGTANPAHLTAAIDAVTRGPLPASMVEELRAAWRAVGTDWPGRI